MDYQKLSIVLHWLVKKQQFRTDLDFQFQGLISDQASVFNKMKKIYYILTNALA